MNTTAHSLLMIQRISGQYQVGSGIHPQTPILNH